MIRTNYREPFKLPIQSNPARVENIDRASEPDLRVRLVKMVGPTPRSSTPVSR